ncbi:MAG TPA: glycosyltransferase [Desulfobacteraceae bacterium]|nr:glycosyltransferase [Desulfobacteraceae bacterium]HPJ66385.1 glycosyltransferase [Desulfobacteraceae bacterium]HPQ27307.1 glycosyltransferase [Desulfobacteraceae bacterium]
MKFSIITICRNDLPNLKATFKSILFQTCQNYEWIVVDGNSYDGTKVWLREIKNAGFRFISEPDNGIYDAMNKGLDSAIGDYVIFMNSGDRLFDENTLQKLSYVIDNNSGPALIYGDTIDVTPSNNQYYRRARPHKLNSFTGFARHQAMVFQKDSIKGLRYNENYKIGADYAFISKLLKRHEFNDIKKIVKVDFPVCCFLLGGRHEKHPFITAFEHYRIRAYVIGQSFALRYTLLVLHLIHEILKLIIPRVCCRIRSEHIKEEDR